MVGMERVQKKESLELPTVVDRGIEPLCQD